jgi:endonuclease-8
VTSPQGRFDAAALLDGELLEDTEAFGKHLMYRFSGERWVHIHLGLFGKIRTVHTPVDTPRETVRLRLSTDQWFTDLVGAPRCAMIGPDERATLLERLGPDPLRPEADPHEAWTRIARSRQPVAALLMNQQVVAGVGNVFRAEVLFRSGLNPFVEGRALPQDGWNALWEDLRRLMRAGVRANRIVSTRPEHRERRRGRARRSDATYVYGRTDEPCRVCGTLIRRTDLMGRRLYWCPSCQ